MDNIKKDIKYDFLNILSGIAILCVVAIHAHGWYMVNMSGFYGNVRWSGYPIIDAIIDFFITFGVATFIFIGGFKYNLRYNIDTIQQYRNYLLKRLEKIYRPFFFITIIFMFLKYSKIFFVRNEPIIVSNIIMDIINSLTVKTVFYQLWFIPMYIFIICAYPVVKKCIKSQLWRMVFLIIIASIVSVKINQTPKCIFYYWFFYLLIYEIGAFWSIYYSQLTKKTVQILAGVIFILIFIIRRMGCDDSVDLYLTNFLRVIGPVCYFYLSINMNKNNIISKILYWLGTYSWPIFLFHEPYILAAFNKTSMLIVMNNPIIHLFFTIPSTILTTVFLCKIIKKTIFKYYIL